MDNRTRCVNDGYDSYHEKCPMICKKQHFPIIGSMLYSPFGERTTTLNQHFFPAPTQSRPTAKNMVLYSL